MQKFWKLLNNIEELFLGYTLLILAFGATYQVTMRYGFGIAYDWFEEWARYLTVLITFVGAGLGVKYGTHFSMEALTQYAPDRFAHLVKVIRCANPCNPDSHVDTLSPHRCLFRGDIFSLSNEGGKALERLPEQEAL
jgi:hypothetical protein